MNADGTDLIVSVNQEPLVDIPGLDSGTGGVQGFDPFVISGKGCPERDPVKGRPAFRTEASDQPAFFIQYPGYDTHAGSAA